MPGKRKRTTEAEEETKRKKVEEKKKEKEEGGDVVNEKRGKKGSKKAKKVEKEDESNDGNKSLVPSYISPHQTKASPHFPKALEVTPASATALSLLSFDDLETRFGPDLVVLCPEDPSFCHVSKCRQFLLATPLWRKHSLLSLGKDAFSAALVEWRKTSDAPLPPIPPLPDRAAVLVCVAPAPTFILTLLLEMLACQDPDRDLLCQELSLFRAKLDVMEGSGGEGEGGASATSAALALALSRLLLFLTGASSKFLSSFRGEDEDSSLPSVDGSAPSSFPSSVSRLSDASLNDLWPEDALKLNPTADELIYGQHFDWEEKSRNAPYLVRKWDDTNGTKQAAAICRLIARAGRENLIRLAGAPFLPPCDAGILDQFEEVCRRVHALAPSSAPSLVQALFSHPIGCRLIRRSWFREHFGRLSPHSLRVLSVEENRGARARAWLYAEGRETFVFSLEEGAEIAKCGNAAASVMCGDEMEQRARHLLGPIWECLADVCKVSTVSPMWVTGSLASAAILLHPDEELFQSFEDMAECRYFVTLEEIDNDDEYAYSHQIGERVRLSLICVFSFC